MSTAISDILKKHANSLSDLMKILDRNWLGVEFSKIDDSKKPNPNYNVDDPKQYRQFGLEKHSIHPLAKLIYDVGLKLQPFYRGIMIDETVGMVMLTEIAESLILMNISSERNKEKLSLLMSEDFSFYEKTLYEIQTAANFVKYGHSSEFLKPAAENAKRTPDILVDNIVEIECKKKSVNHINRSNLDAWNVLTCRAWELMDVLNVNYSIIIETERKLTPADVTIISKEVQNILEQKKTGRFPVSQLELTIDARLLLPYDMEIEGKFDYNANLPSNLQQIVMDVKISGPPLRKWKNARLLGFRAGEIRKLSIISNMRDASDQLSGARPGIVYVDLNKLNRLLKGENDLQQFNTSILNQLKLSTKISALVITADFTTRINGYGKLQHGIYVIRNEQAKNKLDSNFQIPRENESALQSLITSSYLD